MENCVFCKIVHHEEPAHIIYEDEMVLAILDINPISDGHTLIIPKADIRDIHSLDSMTGQRVMEVARLIAGAIEKEFNFDGSMITEVNGAFQDIPHFHLHIFGRSKENDIHITPPKNNKNTPDDLSKTAVKLKKKLNEK
jgi:histidine triad (HIT) family protein